MSDRLAELQRQRALAQEQLAWFDREIAKETGQTPATEEPVAGIPALAATVATETPRPVVDFAAKDAAVARTADDIIAQYQQKAPSNPARDARKGCWLWFIFALGMFAVCVVALYFIYDASK